jgi:DedD protein
MTDTAQDPSLPQKKRARRRLVGAAVLCLGLAAGLPFLFDAEPKKASRVADDVSVTVAKPSVGAPAIAPPVVLAPKDDLKSDADKDATKGTTKDASKDIAKQEPSYEPKPDAKVETKVEAKVETKPEPKVETKKPASSTTVSDLIAKSDKSKEAVKSEKPSAVNADKAKTEKAAKYMVQIGAFGSSTGAQEQIKRAAAIGLKAFTEDVDTNSGKRIRVRVGPFPSKDAADQAREKLKAAGIDSALIAP